MLNFNVSLNFEKYKISKIGKSNFVRMLRTKIQDKFEKIWSQFVEGVAFFKIFSAIWSHFKENEKNSLKFKSQNLKILEK